MKGFPEIGLGCVRSDGGLPQRNESVCDTRISAIGIVSGYCRESPKPEEQLKANPANAPLLDQALPAIADLEAGKRVDTANMPAPLLRLFNPKVQGFLISDFSYDPGQVLKGYPKPVLILQGLRDMQVHETDANILKEADSRATLTLLPDVNHVLKSVNSDDRRANFATYSDASLPLAPGVVSAISDFLTANAKATRSGNLTAR
jgi:uncharacterized protein